MKYYLGIRYYFVNVTQFQKTKLLILFTIFIPRYPSFAMLSHKFGKNLYNRYRHIFGSPHVQFPYFPSNSTIHPFKGINPSKLCVNPTLFK